jgi:hypothetical protein
LQPEEPGRQDVGVRPEPDISGREPVGGERIVQPELGRLPGPLEVGLSRQESEFFRPLTDALFNAQRTNPEYGLPTAEFGKAFRDLRDAVVQRFQPFLDALNVDRASSAGSKTAFGVGIDFNGRNVLHLNDELVHCYIDC